MLSAKQVQDLYRSFCEHDPYSQWRQQYQACLVRLKNTDARTLRTPEVQKNLWSLRELATIGPGDAVSVHGAIADPEVSEAIARLREQAWPDDIEIRAAEMDASYHEIIALVHPKHSEKRPWTRLFRIYAALRPRDVHCAFTTKACSTINRLVLDQRNASTVESSVLVRSRLREHLGPEANLDEDVQRSIFCWWIFENAAALHRGEDPFATKSKLRASDLPTQPPESPEPSEATEPSNTPKLTIAPGPRLRRGIHFIHGHAESIRLVVEVAQAGATPDDIVDALRNDANLEGLSPAAARRIFNRTRYFKMLIHRDGLWYPSESGERLLDDPLWDPLVEHILTQTFGVAHYLRVLKEQALPRHKVLEHLQSVHPSWTTTRMPHSLSRWVRSLQLVHERDGKDELTEYGEEWEERLPEHLPVPPIRSTYDDNDDDVEVDTRAKHTGRPPQNLPPAPSLTDLSARIATTAPEFVVDTAQIRALHLAWHSLPMKRFVIFSGLSGTGKTALLDHYSRAYCACNEIDPERHQVIVPVSPDWRDPSGLLGYFNALHSDPTYQREPALKLVLAAERNPHLPYFLILDEMNLARVEHYFSPFLSAMETGQPLTLHADDDSINGVPPAIRWPKNLFIGGTVNMDETTFAISDKVLDRAFTVEFWDVDLPGYFSRRRSQEGQTTHHSWAEDVLLELGTVLRRVRRHFGYRSAHEVLAFLDAGKTAGLSKTEMTAALDQAIFSKILPRIRGEESELLLSALADAAQTCNKAGLPRSQAKLEHMREILKLTGLTRFWA